MLNDFFLLQVSLILVIFFIHNNLDIFNTILISIFYLIINSLILWLEDLDILVSFLLIIDLGIFFILLALSISFIKFLYSFYSYNISFKNIYFYFLFFLIIVLLFTFFNFNIDYNFNKIIEFIWFFYINFYDFYSISYSVINTDLSVLKEVYFNFNNFEFFLISIFIYFSLIIVFLVSHLIIKLLNYFKNIEILLNLNFIKNKSTFFFKYQNILKQNYTKTSLKIWNKNKNDN